MTKPTLDSVRHRKVDANGIRLHVAELGEGPLLLCLHGFPESWYSWRHQLTALAAAGYRVAAPDQRGYGDSDRPAAIEAYDQVELAADAAGVIEALGEDAAVVVGHDWGAPVAWHTALLHPDRVRAVVGMSIPYGGRPKRSALSKMKEIFQEIFFYMLYFQTPGVAEAELEADVRSSMRRILYTWSGDAPPGLAATPKPKTAKFLEGSGDFETLPGWLTERDLDVYVRQFEASGFRGPLNWYRNFDRTWERTEQLASAKVEQPALFVAGQRDPALLMSQGPLQRMAQYVPKLRDSIVIDDAGHWVQQEAPDATNRALLDFLHSL